MRIIVHLDDPDDMVTAMRSVKSSIEHDYKSCAYGYGPFVSAFVEQTKTGWSVRVQRRQPAGEP